MADTTKDPMEAAIEWSSAPTEHQTEGHGWAIAKSIGDFGKNIAEGVAEDNPATNALVGAISGKVSPAVQHKIEGVGGLFGERVGKAAKTFAEAPKPGILGHAESALVSGGVSLGEWVGFKEISLVGEKVLGLTPLFRNALVAGGLQQKLAQTTAGALSVGAANTAIGAVEGEKPTTKSIGTGMLIGGLLGAAAGRYSPETSARVQKSADQIIGTLGRDGQRSMSNITHVVNLIKQTDPNYTQKEALAVFDKVQQGLGTAGQEVMLKQIFQSRPDLLADPEMTDLYRYLNGKGKPAEPITEKALNEFLDANEKGDLLGVMFGGKSKGIQRAPGDKYVAQAPAASALPEPLQLTHTIQMPDTGEDARIQSLMSKPATPPEEPFGTEVKVSEPVLLPNEVPPTVRAGTPTEAGTPIGAPGIRYAIPPGADPSTSIPAAPILTRPNKLTPSQEEIFSAARGNDWKALEKTVTKGKASASNFERLVLGDVLKPEHVNSSDVARQIAGHLIDRSEGLSADNPKFRQLQDAADAFIDHSAKLRGEAPVPSGRFVRELESGDIVRTTKLDADNSILVDKRGKSAIVATKDLPPAPTKPALPERIDTNNAEHLKQLEHALGNNDDPPPVVPPKSKAGFAFPVEKGGIKGFSKGAITFKRPGVREARDPMLNRFVSMLGGKAHETPEGIVTQIGGVTQVWPDVPTALSGMRALVTDLRKKAEANQVVENAIKTNKLELPQPPKHIAKRLSKALDLAEKMTAQDETTKMPLFESSLVKPRSPFAGGFSKGLATQLGRLKTMGPAGRDLASDIGWYYHANERLEAAHINKPFLTNLQKIDETGLTVSQLRNGSGHADGINLYQQAILPTLNENFADSHSLGIGQDSIFDRAGNTDKLYVPLSWDFKPEDLNSPQLKADMAAMGMPTDPKSMAEIFNSDGKLAAQQTKDAATGADLDQAKRAMNAKWVQRTAASMAGNLEKVRRGNANYIEKVSTSVIRAVRRNDQRLSEAAVFGPQLEKALNHIARIEGFENKRAASEILQDVLGRKRIASGRVSVAMQDLARGKLTGSWTKHIMQVFNLGQREGFLALGKGIAETLAHPFFSHEQARQIGAIIERQRFDIVKGEDLDVPMSESRGVWKYGAVQKAGKIGSDVAKTIGDVGGWPLHRFVNALRTIATNVGHDAFDRYYDKALTGDTNALAHINDMFGKKLSLEQLKQFDKADLRDAAGKFMADKSGGTFRAIDMPAIAREPFGYGKLFLQFNTIRYQIMRNFWEPLINENFNRADRMKFLTRLVLTMPASSLLTAYISRKVLGSTNLSQKELEHSFNALVKDVKKKGIASIDTARQAVFMELESFINSEALGFINDSTQSIIMGGSAKDVEHGLMASPVALGSVANIADSALRTGSAALYGRKSDKLAAVNAVASVFGSASLGFMHGKGLAADAYSEIRQGLGGKPYKGVLRDKSRLPRKQPLRHAITGKD